MTTVRRFAFVRVEDMEGKMILYSMEDLLKLIEGVAEEDPEMVLTIAWRPVPDSEQAEIQQKGVCIHKGSTPRPELIQ